MYIIESTACKQNIVWLKSNIGVAYIGVKTGFSYLEKGNHKSERVDSYQN